MSVYDDLVELSAFLKTNLQGKELSVNLHPYITELQLSNIKKCMQEIEYNSLKIISWEQNYWGEDGFKRLASFFSEYEHLQKFSLLIYVANGLNPVGSQHLANGISALKNLQEISLLTSYNPIKDEGLLYFMDSISKLEKLEKVVLQLDSLQIEQKGIQGTFESLRKLSNLKNLEINLDDDICDTYAEDFQNGFEMLSNLQMLSVLLQSKQISNCNLILNGISKLQKLTTLHMELQFREEALEVDQSIIQMLNHFQNLHTFNLYLCSNENSLYSQKIKILKYISNRNKIINMKINIDDEENETKQLANKARKINYLVLLDFYE